MTTHESKEERLSQLAAELSAAPSDEYPDWKDASDLSRLHIEAFVRSQTGRIRVFGKPSVHPGGSDLLHFLREIENQLKGTLGKLFRRGQSDPPEEQRGPTLGV
jgi:hypothetical protein